MSRGNPHLHEAEQLSDNLALELELLEELGVEPTAEQAALFRAAIDACTRSVRQVRERWRAFDSCTPTPDEDELVQTWRRRKWRLEAAPGPDWGPLSGPPGAA